MQKLPNLTTGITINRVEVWVTNKTGNTTNTRNIVALTDLGENQKLSNPMWAASGQVPSNQANTEYAAMTGSMLLPVTSTRLQPLSMEADWLAEPIMRNWRVPACSILLSIQSIPPWVISH